MAARTPIAPAWSSSKKSAGYVAFIDEVDPTRPDEIKVEMSLRVKYRHQGEGETAQTMLAFKPA